MKTLLLTITILVSSSAICQTHRQLDDKIRPVQAGISQSLVEASIPISHLKNPKITIDQHSSPSKDVKKQKIQRSRLGGVDAGGGHLVLCAGKPPVTLDYFNASIANNASVIDPETSDVETLFLKRLETASKLIERDPLLFVTEGTENGLLPYQSEGDYLTLSRKRVSDEVKSLFERIGPLDSWPDRDLILIDDHKLIYHLPSTCTLAQGAAQDIESNETIFYRNSKLTDLLSKGQKDLLSLHEVLYSISRSYHATDSKSVRVLLQTFLKEDPTDQELVQALNGYRRDLLKAGQKFICETTIYKSTTSPSHDLPNIINLKQSAKLKVFGRTLREATEKVLNFSAHSHVFCEKARAIDQRIGICEELAIPKNSCRVYQ